MDVWSRWVGEMERKWKDWKGRVNEKIDSLLFSGLFGVCVGVFGVYGWVLVCGCVREWWSKW